MRKHISLSMKSYRVLPKRTFCNSFIRIQFIFQTKNTSNKIWVVHFNNKMYCWNHTLNKLLKSCMYFLVKCCPIPRVQVEIKGNYQKKNSKIGKQNRPQFYWRQLFRGKINRRVVACTRAIELFIIVIN